MRTLVKETLEKIGQSVTLNGWVDSIRDHGKITFLDLRDRSGKIQCVGKDLPKVTAESVVEITGTVAQRPEKLINPKIPTGTVEIQIEKLTVISTAKELPFPIDTDGYNIDEDIRLKYRYLDIRRPRMAQNLRLRSKVTTFIRNYLTNKDFVEIETP